jgi:hypothetical protein
MMKKTFVFFAALVLVLGFTLSASAEWNLYGNARIATFYTTQDAPEQGGVQDLDAANQDSVDDLQWNLQGNSRFGANITAGDNIKAQIEFGVTSDGGGGNVSSRRIYGVWDFGPGSLKVGKDYTPITFFLSGQVFGSDAGLLNVGNAYGARRGQLALQFGGFQIAFIDQTTDTLGVVGADTEALLPKLEASFEMKMDAVSWHVFGGYQTYDINFAQGAGTGSVGVDSYMIGAGASFDFGPVFVKPQVSYYQNGAAAGWLFDANDDFNGAVLAIGAIDQLPLVVGTETADVDTLTAMLAVGFKLNENNTLEAGVGYLNSERDALGGNPKAEVTQRLEYYLQWVAQVSPGVFIIPEIGMRDYGDVEQTGLADIDLGDFTYFGAKWQINF